MFNTLSSYEFQQPSAEQVLIDLQIHTPENQHPRLMVTPDTLTGLRKKALHDETAKVWMQDVLKKADEYLHAETLLYGRVDEYRMLPTCRTAKMQIAVLAFAYLITCEEKYAAKATDILLNVCGDNFPDWNPYHFLDVAEMSAGVAIGYDWLYDYFTKEQKEIICLALREKSLRVVLGDFTGSPVGERTWAWYDSNSAGYPNNWISVIYGGTSMAALAIADEGDEEAWLASNVISAGMKMERDFLAVFAPDGASMEGPTYWKYAYEFFAFCFESFQTALGTDYGLSKAPGISNGGYYIIGCTGPKGTFNLNDALQVKLNCFELFWLSKYYKEPGLTKYRLQYMQENNLSPDYRDILFYVPEYGEGEFEIKTDVMFRRLETSCTSVSYDRSDLYVGFHGGDDGLSHGHLDYGHFIIDLFGKRWALDLGYDPKTYHGGYRYNYYRDRGEGHNCLIFNPDNGLDQRNGVCASIERFDYNKNATITIANLTNGHDIKGAKSVYRGCKVDKVHRSVLIQDEIEMIYPSEMYWFMHTPGKISVSEDGRGAVITYGKNKLKAELIGGDNLRLSVMAAAPLPTSPKGEDMADDSNMQKLTIHGTDITKTSFAVKFSPLCGDEEWKASDEVLKEMNQWTLEEEKNLPELSEISVNGVVLSDFIPQKTMYSVENHTGLNKEQECLPIITAAGEGVIHITQAQEDNLSARITVTLGGKENNYFVNFIEREL